MTSTSKILLARARKYRHSRTHKNGCRSPGYFFGREWQIPNLRAFAFFLHRNKYRWGIFQVKSSMYRHSPVFLYFFVVCRKVSIPIDCGSFKLRGSPSWASFFVCNYWCLNFCSRLPATSKIMFPPPWKNDTTHIPTSLARIENTRYSFT